MKCVKEQMDPSCGPPNGPHIFLPRKSVQRFFGRGGLWVLTPID